tara:strand:- start:371 stop:484 length:114 start_codon:yes stop_codon:yes gene_type:complete
MTANVYLARAETFFSSSAIPLIDAGVPLASFEKNIVV